MFLLVILIQCSNYIMTSHWWVSKIIFILLFDHLFFFSFVILWPQGRPIECQITQDDWVRDLQIDKKHHQVVVLCDEGVCIIDYQTNKQVFFIRNWHETALTRFGTTRLLFICLFIYLFLSMFFSLILFIGIHCFCCLCFFSLFFWICFLFLLFHQKKQNMF